MIVTLLEQDKITNIYLPAKKKGIYWIRNGRNNEKLISIEAYYGKWLAKSTSSMWFLGDEKQPCDKMILKLFHLYTVQALCEDTISHIMVEPDVRYERVQIVSKDEILIGRGRNNDICLNSSAVSSVHARLCKRADRWILLDEDSTNGTYVNNQRVRGSSWLEPGDIIYIMGFRIIMGKGFLAIGNPKEGMVTMNAQCFVPIYHKPIGGYKNDILPTIDYYTPGVISLTGDETLEECVEIIEKERNTLWTLTREHPNFLNIRIGENKKIDLKACCRVGVKGSWKQLEQFAKGFLLHVVTSYSYKDVKVICLLDDKMVDEWSMVRWLPHLYDSCMDESLFARNSSDVKHIVKQIQRREWKNNRGVTTNSPCYIVFGWDRMLEQVWNESCISHDNNVMHISLCDNNINDILQCDYMIELEKETGRIWTTCADSLQAPSKMMCHEFIPDKCAHNIDMLCLELANTYLDDGGLSERTYRVELYVPAYERTYDMTVPCNKRICEIIPSIEKQLKKKEPGYVSLGDITILCEREAGIVLDVELTPEESGILNGTRLMLI